MARADLLLLPVVDCPQLEADLRAGLAMLAKPTPAEMAERAAAKAGAGSQAKPAPPDDAQRQRLQELRAQFVDGRAEAQWATLGEMERRMLVAYAGLRETNPGEHIASIAGRAWGEFVPSEQQAIGQAVRMLLRKLAALTRISGRPF